MRNKVAISCMLLALLIALIACASPTNSTDTDTQATIDAAVQATHEAEQNAQATIDVAVQATVTQIQDDSQSAIATAVQATLTAQPTPDYANLSEEELSAMIDEAVSVAMTDAESASTSTSQAASDGTVSDEEVAATTETIYQTYYEVAYAEELIQAYYDYYGEYADEALATLNEMEDDLNAISQDLEEVSAIMEQGAETASEAIEQLNDAADQLKTKSAEVQDKAQGWSEKVKASLGQRESDLLNLKPDQIESDKIGALIQAHDFLDAFKGALSDGKFSPAELKKIGQLGANARASLIKTGDPQFAKFGNAIEGLTRNAARGEWGHARSGAGDLEHSLPKRPARRK